MAKFPHNQPPSRPSARITRRAVPGHRFFPSAHSHTRSTVQPARRSVRVTSRSRAALRENFAAQKAARVAGCVACRGQPCQKHPSTNTATRSLRKTKSGFPNTRAFRRQPVISCARSSAIIRSSVAAFPLPRMRAITALRFTLVKMSATSRGGYAPAGSHIGRVTMAGSSRPAACKSAISSRTSSRSA